MATKIQGLKGINDISNRDYEEWKATQLKLGTLTESSTEQYQDNLYRAQQFVQKYGADVYESMPNMDAMNKYAEDRAVEEAFTQRYGEDTSDFAGISSVDAKRYLLENEYKTTAELEKLYSDLEKQTEERDKVPEGFFDKLLYGASHNYSNPSSAASNHIQSLTVHSSKGHAFEKQSQMLENAQAIDADYTLNLPEVKQNTEVLKQHYFNRTDRDYDAGVKNTYTELNNDFLELDDNGQALFPNYYSFSDNGELNLTTSQLVELHAGYDALLEEGRKAHEKGDDDLANQYYIQAHNYVENTVKKILHDQETFSGFMKKTMIGAGVNAYTVTAGIPNTLLGMYYDLTADLSEENMVRAINFKKGLDEYGNEISPMLNTQYFQDVSNYSTIDPEEIKRKKQLGLVNTNQYVRPAGAEYDWFTKETFGEGVQMIGYAAPALVEMVVTKSMGPTIARMNAKIATTALKAGANAQKVAKAIGKTERAIGSLANYTLHAAPMAASEARSSWDIVHNELYNDNVVAEQMNSPKVQEALRNAVKEEIDKMLAQEFPNGATFSKVNLDGQPTLINNMEARREQLYNEYGEQLYNAFYEDYEKNKLRPEMEAIADKGSYAAFVGTFNSHMIKQAPIDMFLKRYMYYTPLVNRTASTALSTTGKIANYSKTIAKAVAGGGIDEFTDENVNQASQKMGIDIGNNYYKHLYNGDTIDLTGSIYNKMFEYSMSYVEGFSGATLDPSTWQQAFVGAIAPITNIAPKAGMFKSSTYKNWKQNGTMNSINSMIYNPIVSELTSTYNERKQSSQDAEIMQNILIEHAKDYKDFMTAFSMLSQMEEATQDRDRREGKDARFTVGFQHLINTERLLNENQEMAQDYMQAIQELADGTTISEETVNQFLAANEHTNTDKSKNNTDTAMAVEQAKEEIQKNAQKLLKMHEEYKRRKATVNSLLGNTLTEEGKNQLVYMSMMGVQWQDRIKQMQETLGLSGTRVSNRFGQFGSVEKFNEKQEADFHNELTEIDKLIELSGGQGVKAKYLKKRKKEIIKKLGAFVETTVFPSEEAQIGGTVLSAQEILSLDYDEILSMLNNKNRYSQEQIEEIEKAETTLMDKDADYMNTLFDLSLLNDKVYYNNEAYKYIISHPNELKALQVDMQRSLAKKAIDKVVSMHVRDLVKQVNSIVMDDNLSIDEIRSKITELLNKQSKATLEHMLKETDTSSIGVNQLYEKVGEDNKLTNTRTLLYNAIETAQLFNDISDVIKQWDIPTKGKVHLLNNIQTIIGKAKDAAEARQLLEDAIDNNSIDVNTREWLNTILDTLIDMGYQRDATVLQNREKRKKREEARKKREEEKKQKEEERKKKEEETRKAREEKEKAEAEKNKETSTLSPSPSPTESVETGETINIVPEEKTEEKKEEPKAEPTKEEATEEGTKTPEESTVTMEEGEIEILSPEEKEAYDKNQESVSSPTEKDIVDDDKETVKPVSELEQQPISDNASNEEESIADTATSLLGLPFYRYVIDKLHDRILSLRSVENKSFEAGDLMDSYFKWLVKNNIHLQEIVDYELADIAALKPDVHVIVNNPSYYKKDENMDSAINTIPLLAVEYTDQIHTIHKDHAEERGGVITVGDKQYLVIGTLGYGKNNDAQKASWSNIMKRVETLQGSLDKETRFAVLPSFRSKIQSINKGSLVTSVENGANRKGKAERDIADILKDPAMNPRGIKFEDIPWMLQMATKVVYSKKLFYPVYLPNQKLDNAGGLFALFRGADGRYVPFYIRPRTLSEINEYNPNSKLMQTITDLVFNGLCNPNHNDRLDAVKKLSHLLYFDKDRKNTVLIGTEAIPKITIVSNGVKVVTFDVSKDGIKTDTAQNIFNEMLKANFRVNFTQSTVTIPTEMEMMRDSGALQLDAAVLGTVGAGFKIYNVDSEGNPINVVPTQPIKAEYKGTNPSSRDTVQRTLYNGKTYQLIDGKYYENGKEVTDATTIQNIEYIKMTDGKTPNLNMKDGYDAHILNDRDGEQLVVARNKNNRVKVYKGTEAQSIIEEYKAEERRKNVEVTIGETINIIDETPTSETTNVTEETKTKTETKEQKEEVKEESSAKPTTPVAKEKKNVNKIRKKDVNVLQESKKMLTFVALTKSRQYRDSVKDVLTKKFGEDFYDKSEEERIAILKQKEIPTVGIEDVEAWLNNIKNCK